MIASTPSTNAAATGPHEPRLFTRSPYLAPSGCRTLPSAGGSGRNRKGGPAGIGACCILKNRHSRPRRDDSGSLVGGPHSAVLPLLHLRSRHACGPATGRRYPTSAVFSALLETSPLCAGPISSRRRINLRLLATAGVARALEQRYPTNSCEWTGHYRCAPRLVCWRLSLCRSALPHARDVP